MGRSSNQKLKLLYLMGILQEFTDEDHAMSLSEILAELQRNGISAERKSLYDDMESLRTYGIDIVKTGGRNCGYYIANRTFELPELKLLVDAVQSSKFITVKKSNELIKKVESLASKHEASLLQRQVYVTNRIKTMNESIYYNVDKIHNAISFGKQIRFLYFEWVVDFQNKEKIKKRYRRHGACYQVSPWSLTWDDENYYLIAFDSQAGIIKHFRVDKMERIEVTDQQRDGQSHFRQFDMATYSKKMFGMFSGEERNVKICFANHLIGVVIDRFGKDVFISQRDENYFTVTAKVVASPQFMGWLFSFGHHAMLLSPEDLREEYRKYLSDGMRLYQSNAKD